METIRQGTGDEFTLAITLDGAAFSLTDTDSTLTVRDATGTALLIQRLTVNEYGVSTLELGLEVGPDGVAAGEIVQTITNAEAAALPVGILSWALEVVDSEGRPNVPLWGQYNVVASTYMVGLSGPNLTTKAELRRRVASRLGDYDRLKTTGATDASHLMDTLNVSGATETYNGRYIVVADGPNAGHISRVQATSESTNTLTITPAAPYAFTAGISIDVFNLRSRGWAIWEYDDAINNAMDDAQPLSMATYVADISPDFDRTTPYFVIPDCFTAVYAVGWVNPDNGSFVAMPPSRTSGWSVQQATSGGPVVTVSPRYGMVAHDQTMRLYGYGRYAPLRAETDATTLRVEWIVTRAAYHLCVNGVTREQQRGNLILLLKQESDAMLSGIRTLPEPLSQMVR